MVILRGLILGGVFVKRVFRSAFPLTIPVLLGYISVGIAFGLLVVKSDLDLWVALLMSVLVYAGAMQFLAIQLLVNPISILQVAIITLFVNIRHLFYGLSFIDLFKTFGFKKHYMIFALTDETYSLLCAIALKEDMDQESLFFAVSFLNQLYWVTGTLIGYLIGSWLVFDTTGIEFAMTALFIVIFIEQWLGYKDHRPSLIGLGASLLAVMVFGPDNMILPAMVIILMGLLGSKSLIESKEVRS